MQESISPYALGALQYFSRGWTDVFPVGTLTDPYAKAPVPKGVTGYDAGPVGWNRIKLGTQQAAGRRNLGVRMPRQVICLDVDEYQGHTGGLTLEKAESELGPLPATYRSTARGPGMAGHRFYRCGLGRTVVPGAEELLARMYGPNIDILHYGRRYAVVWPSLNPDVLMAQYRWYGPDGKPCDVPAVTDIPVLPKAWQDLLTAELDSPAAQRTAGGNLRAERGEAAADTDDGLFSDAGMVIRRSVAGATTIDQLAAVLAMKEGEVNRTLGGAGIWYARMANAGLFTLEQAMDVLVAAAGRNGVHSDAWNKANKRRWTLKSRLRDALSQGLNRPPFSIIDDHAPVDMYAQLMARVNR